MHYMATKWRVLSARPSFKGQLAAKMPKFVDKAGTGVERWQRASLFTSPGIPKQDLPNLSSIEDGAHLFEAKA